MTDNQNPDEPPNADSEEQMRGGGQAGTEHPSIKLDPTHVPSELHRLIPYAEKWGIKDKELQRKLMHEAPLEEIEELYTVYTKVVYSNWHRIMRFARSRPSSDEPGGYEAGIFDALDYAAGEASLIVNEAMPEKWLEIIGWPEQYPSIIPDPTNLPPDFHPLVPYAEKWAIDDDAVRETVIRAATDEELDQLVTAINQIGDKAIKNLALKLSDDETREESGYALLILLDATGQAETLLKTRRGSSPS